ncbi:MAG: hypothetical protein JXB00_16495 [Bacteroidales bacterium]|nr:hypothetical protein [Bacteroidales bacterium]
MTEISLDNALRTILNSSEKNIQIDFFRENGQVIAQIYKQKDVKKWALGIELVNDQGLIIELNFNNAKLNNKLNYNRFKKSKFYNQFQKFQLVKENSYFLGINDNKLTGSIIDLLHEVFLTVYQITPINYKYTVNAY